MKKTLPDELNDDLRPEYDFSQLKGGVRGKYYRQAVAGSNLVLIDPELFDAFPDSASVNRALRLLVDTAEAATHASRRRTPSKQRKSSGGMRRPVRRRPSDSRSSE